MKRLHVSVLVATVGCMLATGVSAQTAQAQKRLDERRQSLTESVKKQLFSMNINQSEKFQIDLSFSTFHGMYAYRELLLWAAGLPAESAEKAGIMTTVRDGLTAVVWHSGMGLPIDGWTGEGQPVGLIFDRGEPLYAEIPDFSRPETLKWQSKHFVTRVSPESIGLSLATKSLYVRTATGPQDVKLNSVLLESALREFATLQSLMKLAISKDGGTHMPALVKQNAQKGGEWEVVADQSFASGQFSLLLGLAQLQGLLAAKGPGDETVAGRKISEWRKDVRQAIDRTFSIAIAQHFDSEVKSFVSQFSRQKGVGERLAADDAGLIMETLAFLVEPLPMGDPLRAQALSHLDAQAATLVKALTGKDVVPRGFLIRKGLSDMGVVQPIGEQLAIVDGLLAAAKATGNEGYAKTAGELFESVRAKYWSEPAGIFRAVPGQLVAGYDGRVFGVGLAAWRRMESRLPAGDARRHGSNLISSVIMKSGLLRAQSPMAGETRQPEDFVRDDLDRLVEEVLMLPSTERAKRTADAVRAFADQNQDSVPGCRYGGGRFGAAPVLVTQTSITVPFEAPASPTPTKE